MAALNIVCGSVWSASLFASQEVYLRVISPALMYGTLVWYRPGQILKQWKTMAKKIQTIPGRCLRVISGAYKATSIETLEVEIGIEPLDLFMSKLTLKAVARIKLSDSYQGIARRTRAILGRRRRRRRVPASKGLYQTLTDWIETKVTQPLQEMIKPGKQANNKAKKFDGGLGPDLLEPS